MTLIYTEKEYPSGIVIKESGPKVLKFTIDEINPDRQEITHDTVHSVVIDLQEGNTWQIIAVQKPTPANQDLLIQCWISKKPYGLSLPPVWHNLNVFSLIKQPSVIYVAETTATINVTDPSLKILPADTYYINLHNRHGGSAYYQIVMNLIT